MPSNLPSHNTDTVQTRTFAAPFIVLAGIVFASATQTEVANYLAQRLEYNKPYFSFFVTHVAFAFVFPIHLAILAISKGGARGATAHARYLLRNLRAVLADQLNTRPRWRELWRPLTHKLIPLTLLISFPAICWYVAMALSPAMDITAIYATSAFHTYFFSLLLLGTRLTKITVAAIAVAFTGVIVITLDDAGHTEEGKDGKPSISSRLVGDIIMVVGAAGLGLYEVVYKMVLPEGEGGAHRPAGEHATSPIATTSRLAHSHGHATPPQYDSATEYESEDDRIALSRGGAGSRTPLLNKSVSVPSSPTSERPRTPIITIPRPTLTRTPSGRGMHVPHLPTAFHSNFLTSALGVATFVLLWIPFPFIHWTGVETWLLPPTPRIWGTLSLAASLGAVYNAGLMTLIGMWGPTVASVANLLTIGLVGIADALWVGTIPSAVKVGGAALICAGFAALLWEGEAEG